MLTGDKRAAKTNPQHFPAKEIRTETIKIGDGRVELENNRVSKRSGGANDEVPAAATNWPRSFRVPENEGAISFVRLKREDLIHERAKDLPPRRGGPPTDSLE